MPPWGRKRVLVRRGNAYGLELVCCTSGFDSEGRFRSSFHPNPAQTIGADTILMGIGQEPPLSFTVRGTPSSQAYLKFRLRTAIDFPIVGLVSVLTINAGKVKRSRPVLGAVGSQPLRLREGEDCLQGKSLNE